jgi:hypothetical protein
LYVLLCGWDNGIDKPDLIAAKAMKSLLPFQLKVLPGDRCFKGVSVKPASFYFD